MPFDSGPHKGGKSIAGEAYHGKEEITRLIYSGNNRITHSDYSGADTIFNIFFTWNKAGVWPVDAVPLVLHMDLQYRHPR
jgi:hypothetical protein